MHGLSEVAYCGFYCPNCGERCRVPRRAAALIEEMIVGEYGEWGHALEGFLHRLADVVTRNREAGGNLRLVAKVGLERIVPCHQHYGNYNRDVQVYVFPLQEVLPYSL